MRCIVANTLRVEAVPKTNTDGVDVPPTEVKVTVESAGERDLSAHLDGMTLVQMVATAIRLTVSVRESSGDADDAA